MESNEGSGGNREGIPFRLTREWDVESAKRMTLVAMVFQAIVLAGALLVGPLLLFFGIWQTLPPWVPPLVVASWIVLGSLLILTYYLVYRALIDSGIQEARAPCLVLGLLGLFGGGVVSGWLRGVPDAHFAIRIVTMIGRGLQDARGGNWPDQSQSGASSAPGETSGAASMARNRSRVARNSAAWGSRSASPESSKASAAVIAFKRSESSKTRAENS